MFNAQYDLLQIIARDIVKENETVILLDDKSC